MLAIARFVAVLTLFFYSAASHAIYKCEENGKITYSDEQCESGSARAIDTTNSRLTNAAVSEATERNKRNRETLKQLESTRQKEEATEEKARQKKLRASEALRKKCQAMALKVKWSEEDAAAATGKSINKAKRTASRQREKYEAECGKR